MVSGISHSKPYGSYAVNFWDAELLLSGMYISWEPHSLSCLFIR
uniref:Uncharacterized protein n=1 Tax=Anguilla anguilla TaxID=7936 RepID=A0A0E9XQ73_ANGAN